MKCECCGKELKPEEFSTGICFECMCEFSDFLCSSHDEDDEN